MFHLEEGLRGNLFSEATNTVDSQGNIVTSVGGASDIYNWLQSVVVDSIFVDPPCGDGVCDEFGEHMGWYDTGCTSDCGAVQSRQMTDLIVEVTANFDDEDELEVAEWDLCSPDTMFGHDICRYATSLGHGKRVRRLVWS